MIFKDKKKIFLKFRDKALIIIVIIILGTAAVKAIDIKIGKTSQKNISQCPSDMAMIMADERNFCIDKYEASAGPSCTYANPQNQSDTRINLSDSKCAPLSQPELSPWRFISRDQAVMACAKAGKRLPTNEEWQMAALGTPDINLNWGEDDCQVNNNWTGQPGLTGSGINCVSSAGAYDMIGNVWEWVKETVDNGKINDAIMPGSGFIDATDGKGLPTETNINSANPNYNEDYLWIKSSSNRAIARGGYWNNKSDAGQYAVYIVALPATAEVGIGFRCAKNLY
jgi:formylglycine-generating enzyme required for sulfatase activity